LTPVKKKSGFFQAQQGLRGESRGISGIIYPIKSIWIQSKPNVLCEELLRCGSDTLATGPRSGNCPERRDREMEKSGGNLLAVPLSTIPQRGIRDSPEQSAESRR
jgi:hypothetical protein